MKKIASLLLCVLVFTSLTAFTSLPKVVDNSHLLSSTELASLSARADELSEQYDFDIVIVTTDSLEGKTATEYADDYFDYEGYGAGENRDGVLFLVSMEERDWWISTRGLGIDVFTDYGIEYIGEQVVPQLSDGNYAEAFSLFLSNAEQFLKEAANGTPYDVRNRPESPNAPVYRVLIALALALVLATCVAFGLKAQMNSAKPQQYAGSYVSNFNLQLQRDIFLYSHTSRTKRQTDSGGGSSTHTGSSGATHGGGGGKF